MRKVSKCFADSKIIPIFAPAILEKTSGNALFGILHDRLTSFDLVKSGKFNPIEVKSSLVKPVLYPDEGHGLPYYICDFGYFQNLTRQVCREDVSFSFCRINVKRKTIETMYYPRNYRCLSCGKKFTLSDGVIRLPSAGVPCPHCGSKKTKERFLGGLIDFVGILIRVVSKKNK